MDNEAWRKFMNFGTQNMVSICTLILRQNLEYFLNSILGKLYIISKIWSSKSNTSNNIQLGFEMRKLCTFETDWLEKNVEFEIHYAFWTHPLDFKLDLSLPLMGSKLTWNSPKFWTQLLVIDFEPRDMSKRVPNDSIQF